MGKVSEELVPNTSYLMPPVNMFEQILSYEKINFTQSTINVTKTIISVLPLCDQRIHFQQILSDKVIR